MHFIKRLGVVWIAVAAVACSKQTGLAKEEQDAGSRVTGTWQWVRTDGGIGYNIHDTPLSTGKAIALELNSDSSYAIYTNGSVTVQGTYHITTGTCIHDHTEKPLIHFSAGYNLMIEKNQNNVLTMSDEMYDGVNSQYQRAVIIK